MDNLEISQRFAVRQLSEQDAIVVPVPQWRRTMQRIKECGEHTSFYDALGWCAIGFGASALLSALTNFGSMTFASYDEKGHVIAVYLGAIISEVVCWVFGLGALALGYVALRFAKQHEKDRAEIRLMIVQDMEEHERNHQPVSQSGAA